MSAQSSFIDEDIKDENRKTFETMQDTIGIIVHHDAVTGTSPDETVRDYEQRIINAAKLGNKLHSNLIA